MYYLQSRYYNPEWGRFINADAIGGNIGQLLSHNVFTYCKNNPVNLSDPSGYLAEFNWEREDNYSESTLGDALSEVGSVGFLICALGELLLTGNKAGIDVYAERDAEVESKSIERNIGKVEENIVDRSKAIVNKGQQNKHIPSTNEYKVSLSNGDRRSILLEDPKKLLEQYAGKGDMFKPTRERIDCGSNVIGLFYDFNTKTYYGTTRCIIHYNESLTKAHIIPSEPY